MKQVVALVSACCLFLQGCTAMQTVPVPQTGSGQAAVQVGDTVEVTTREGQAHRFKVTEVTDDALAGKDISIAYADISGLKVAQRNEAKSPSWPWVLGGAAVLALLIAAGGSGGSSY